jgi:methylated-DNA-[protein]-cysteine S-methyltransferase
MGTEDSYEAVVAAPVGLLGVRLRGEQLVAIDIAPPHQAPRRAASAATREVLDQLFRYFEDPRFQFQLPMAPEGTAYQRRVWQALVAIPWGTTRTYGELAAELGSSARAVGGACRRNPIPIVVPCHRVVSATGLGGFMGRVDGQPLAVKQWLIAHESRG